MDDSDVFSSTGSIVSHNAAARNQEIVLAKSETRAVRSFKALFLLVLTIFAVAACVVIYLFVKNAETAEFTEAFKDDASKVLASFGANLENTLSAADAFAVSVMSHAKATNQQWPFVVISDFAIRAGKVRDSTSAYIVNLYVYVEDEERTAWEAFTANETNNYWVDESIEVQAKNPHYNGPITPDHNNWNVIHGYDEFEKENPGEFGTDKSGPYLVWWQCYPVVAFDPVYNWDLLTSYHAGGFDETLLREKKTVISAPYMLWLDSNSEEQKQAELAEAEWLKNYVEPGENVIEPLVDIHVPLLDESVNSFDVYKSTLDDETTFRGTFSLSTYWREMMKDILPEGSFGVVLVVDNDCTESFTYEINGPRVLFLGGGDQHDSAYDELELASALLDLRQFAIKDPSYTGPPVVDSFCPYTVRVFPSDKFESRFTSKNGILYGGCALSIFALTCAFFLIYDYCVERRQSILHSKAIRSEALVSSLFPSNIRDRLEENVVNGSAEDFGNQGGTKTENNDAPIADLFPNTTILFADIVGFTQWSSTRDPGQVFGLLEPLYATFDELADQHKVFKVETIGDCYVAVTGLPDPQTNHASIMVRFATKCSAKMKKLVRSLEGKLGMGTSDLKLRIGLHSGPVTAGVLRGRKSRFQLFGDSVNVAARMESTGVPNKIHISQATANTLETEGKGSWIVKRTEEIYVKGKGKMQTYFAEYSSASPHAGDFETSEACLKTKNQLKIAFPRNSEL